MQNYCSAANSLYLCRIVHNSISSHKLINFSTSKKCKKLTPWTHIFVHVCLCIIESDTVPSEYSLLTANGLGKKKVHLYEQSNAGDIHKAITESFPKLYGAGRYQLLRVSG